MKRSKITDRLTEIYDTAQDLGIDPAAEKLGLTRETVRRAKREYMQLQSELAESKPPEIENNDFNISDRKLLDQLRSRFTDREIKAILNGSEQRPNEPCNVDFKGTKVKFGIIGDTHIGSKFFKESSLMLAFKTFEEENVDFILHVGDVTEGMSNRPGHPYELTEQGFHAQKQKAIELFSKTDIPIYAIDGNHDRWYIKSNGAKIVSDIADMVPNFHFVGHDKALLKFGKLNVMLFHGEDMGGGSLSLRGQRVIEALPETSKPHVVYTGHNHKYVTFEHRGVYVASIPSIQEQTDYLASKSVVAHTGFVISEIVFNGKEIVRHKVERFKI